VLADVVAELATMLTQLVTEFATGGTTLFVQCTSVDGAEAETAGILWPEGAWLGFEWGVHGLCSFFRQEARSALPIR
jgi:hypothetical protein